MLIIYYYVWLQLPFKTKVSQRLQKEIKNLVSNSKVLNRVGSLNKLRMKKFQIQKRSLSLIDRSLFHQRFNKIPSSIVLFLSQDIMRVTSGAFEHVLFLNIIGSSISSTMLDTRNFIFENPLIKANIRSIYHLTDMIVICDLLSLGYGSAELLGKLISKMLERSSKKGLFIRSLRLLSKMPRLIKQFEVKHKRNSNRD